MRRLPVVVVPFLVATSLFAQQHDIDHHLRGQLADGSQLLVDAPEPATGVIVEFVDAPLVLQSSSARRVKMASYRATFDRFRSDAAAILSRAQRRVVEPQIRWEYFETFNGVSVDIPRAQLDAIRALPYVKAIHPDVIVHALDDAAPTDNITKIKADQLWAQYGTRGAGVVIAIIDTGIDYRHPSLGGGFGPGYRVIGGYDFVNKDNDPMDDHFHGTHVAGIAAARSADLVGVAPEASLIAFKVLGANGSGSESNVLAAIERTVDPNGDGDTRDRVDVANLSLGGSGNPDDPQSIAIDNATAAGVVFAVAAGNSGASFHTIGSPGTSRRAITVGAVDTSDGIAGFTSRGPNMKNLAIKPEVMAPGVNIRSTLPNGTFGLLSGTSMATPHIAGVAALLKAAHRDWTPAQIKSAIVNSSTDLGSDLMTEGGGRVDALAAAGATFFADPPVFNLGLDSPTPATWSSSQTVRVTNGGSQPMSLTFTPAVIGGVTVTMSPSTLSLNAGQSADLTMSVNVTNALASGHTNSFSVGGQLAIAGADAGTHMTFGFTRAARATVNYDGEFPSTIWFAPTTTLGSASIGEHATELIAKPGTFDFVVFSLDFGDRGKPVDARVIYRENLSVDGDVSVDVSAADAKHVITLNARDENGNRLADRIDWFVALTRLLLHPDWQLTSLTLPALPVTTLLVSDLNAPKVLVTEELFDNDNRHLVVVQHDPVSAPSGDITLTNSPSDLKTTTVRLFIPPWGRNSITRVTVSPLVASTDDPNGGVTLSSPDPIVPEIDWKVAMTPLATNGYWYVGRFTLVSDTLTAYQSGPINASSIGMNTGAPWTYAGDTMTLGFGPNLPLARVTQAGTTSKSISTQYVGQFGETRIADTQTVTTTLTVGKKAPIDFKNNNLIFDVPPGPIKLDVKQSGLMSGAVARTTTISLSLDTTRTDFSPPMFTYLALFDANGRATNHLDPHGGGSLLFSIADFVNGNGAYQQIRPEATQVFYRVNGTTSWLPLTATQVDEKQLSGILYRVDLGNATNADRALIDIRIDGTDVAGNSASLVVQPAFAVGADAPPHQRTAGK